MKLLFLFLKKTSNNYSYKIKRSNNNLNVKSMFSRFFYFNFLYILVF